MPEFLVTRGITSKIETIISSAKERVMLISPYLNYIPPEFLSRIEDAIEDQVRVGLIFRDWENIHSNEIEKIKAIKGLELFQNYNVHAKAYFNEKEGLVTSFNISEHSEKNNHEFGIYFTKKDSEDLYNDLVRESYRILKRSTPKSINHGNNSFIEIEDSPWGTCIRCGINIPFNTNKPFCYKCYGIWSEYGNSQFIEKHCHQCGKYSSTTMANPICNNCSF